eukprot:TRINITY_DN2760_c0_g1_i2.p1 TRINITY_DN2760_c0_g1~~TRINITY_DN2760_c0_g1_i2.p1  ORF type:complete len:219 (+),score=20.81 TRINITY_DN2760_c0_g1_i2:86-658(+)
MSEARGMSAEQIDAKVDEIKTELFHIRMKQATRQKFTPSEMPALRRDIARLLTAKRESELEQGVSKRESRNAEKQRQVAAGTALQLVATVSARATHLSQAMLPQRRLCDAQSGFEPFKSAAPVCWLPRFGCVVCAMCCHGSFTAEDASCCTAVFHSVFFPGVSSMSESLYALAMRCLIGLGVCTSFAFFM